MLVYAPLHQSDLRPIMKKTDKKRENAIRQVLTDLCDEALDLYEGFEWLTHRVDYSRFPKSLKVICVFDTNANLKEFMKNHQRAFNDKIQKGLGAVEAPIADTGRQIKYDTEENCEVMNGGDWGDRLAP